MLNSSPTFLDEAKAPMTPESQDCTPTPPSEAAVDETSECLTLGENYENSAAPGPIRPSRKAMERFHEPFAYVIGRLTLLNTTKKYTMTVGEVHRRINGPETVHTSMLNGILRVGKGKNNGVELRDKIKDYGIELPFGRRKKGKMSLFTSLCEAEARELAKDFNNLCSLKGSVDVLAKEYLEDQINQGVPFSTIASEITAVENFMNYMIRLNPSELYPEELDSTSPAERSVENMSLLTHGFSHVAISGIANYFGKMASEARNILYRAPETFFPGHMQPSPATQAITTASSSSPPTSEAECSPPTEASPANSLKHPSQPCENPPTIHHRTDYSASFQFYPFHTHSSPLIPNNFAQLQSQLMQNDKLSDS